tara:strand:+ start:404172 stop:405032 length:861 start_codon:yes stop_codon:yes gene_type:complete
MEYFKLINGQTGRNTGYIMVRRPPINRKRWKEVQKRYEGKIIGISCNRDFPRKSPDVVDVASGWLHVFRDPQAHGIPESMPQMLLGESDFVSVDKRFVTKKKRFDFYYVCLGSSSQRRSKNFKLFQASLPILCGELGLRGVVIGMKQFKDMEQWNSYLTWTGRRRPSEVFNYIGQSRFGFFPNVTDASPKALTEGFALNVPSLVNNKIYGGWKYIDDQTTGHFFNPDLTDLKEKAKLITAGHYSARDTFYKDWGTKNASRKLGKFLRDIYGKQGLKKVYIQKAQKV